MRRCPYCGAMPEARGRHHRRRCRRFTSVLEVRGAIPHSSYRSDGRHDRCDVLAGTIDADTISERAEALTAVANLLAEVVGQS